VHDIRFALRSIAGRPWFTLAIVATLALGIGINTTVFTLVNAVLFKPLPFPNGDRLVTVANRRPADGDRNLSVSYLDLQDLRTQSSTFEALEGASIEQIVVSESDVPPERLRAGRVSAGFFDLVEARPVHGRAFTPTDDDPGAAMTVVLGHDVWTNRYNMSPDVIGRVVRIDNQPATIVGVMPPGFQFPNREQLWLPLIPRDDERRNRDARNLLVVGLMRPDVSITQAAADLSVVAARLASEHPTTNEAIDTRIQTFNERFNGGEIRIVFLLMLAAVAFVLLIACANVANMMLSRALTRRREMAVRSAVGASRWRLVRQLLVESVLLSCAGGVAGLGLATVGVQAFDSAVQDSGKPSWIIFSVDYVVLAYCSAVCVVCGILFGLAPALRSSRVQLNEVLKEGGRSGSSHGGKLSAVLVVIQFALAVVLLAGAGLLIRSFMSSQQVNDFVPRDAILTARVTLPDDRYSERDERTRFFDDVHSRMNAIPGVIHTAIVSDAPGRGGPTVRFELEGATVEIPSEREAALRVAAAPGYFEAINLPILRGRDFDDRDGVEGREAAIVTSQFAERYWPDRNPIGQRFRFNAEQEPGPWLTVVGVAAPLVQGQNSGAPEPLIFVPLRQNAPTTMLVMLRTDGDANRLAGSLRAEVQAMDAMLPVSDVETMAVLLWRARWPYRVFGAAFGLFAIAALLMAGVGLYAVMAQATQRRTREIGIRVALGATPARVLRTVMSRGVVQLTVGLALGLGLAYATTGSMRALLFGVAPTDPVVLVSSTLALVAVGLFACGIPAWRAAVLAPVRALNSEER
jgi:putative ABC transport system permease protein